MKTRILWIVTGALVIVLAAVSLTQNHKPQMTGKVKKASGGDDVPFQVVFEAWQAGKSLVSR